MESRYPSDTNITLSSYFHIAANVLWNFQIFS